MTIKAIYVYTDDRGRPVLRKLREDVVGKKRFRVQAAKWYTFGDDHRPNVLWKGGKGCVDRHQPVWGQKVIFNLPVVLSALEKGDQVWITEGERDAESLASVARLATTTTHQGIERMTPEQAAWFVRGDSRIHILMDNDDAGAFGGWARWVALTEAGVEADRLRLWRPADGFKDITEALASVGLGGVRRSAVRRVGPGPTKEASERYGANRAVRYSREEPS